MTKCVLQQSNLESKNVLTFVSKLLNVKDEVHI